MGHRQDSSFHISEEWLFDILRRTGNAALIIDKNGHILRLSHKSELVLGWSEKDALGLPLDQVAPILHEDTHVDLTPEYIKLFAQNKSIEQSSSFLLISKSDQEIPATLSATPVVDPQTRRTGTLIVFQAHSKEQDTIQALRESEERLQMATKAVKLGCYEWNIQKGTLHWDVQMHKMFELSLESKVNRNQHFNEVLHPDDRERVTEGFQKSMNPNNTDTTFESEFKVKLPSDTVKHIASFGFHFRNKEGQVTRIVGTCLDITHRKNAEEELKQREYLLSMAQEASSMGIWSLNVQTNELWLDDKFLEILDYERETFQKRAGRNLHHPDEFEDTLRKVDAHLRGDDPVYIREQRVQAKSGWIWMHIRAKVVEWDREGKSLRMIGTALDITERKQAEQEKARLEEQYHQAQKMESIGRLAGGISHDLNNLLTPILSYGEMLQFDLASGDSMLQESVEEILRAGFRAKDLVGQLLAFSRKQTLQYKLLDMNQVINDFEKLLRRTIRENIAIRKNLFPQLKLIKADLGQIEQLILNLAINASDAMPEGGHLIIETSHRSADDLDLTGKSNGAQSYVTLTFSDTGTGMSEDIQDRIFEPFFSTKGDQGTGLGLATVYGIVKQHEGDIQVQSAHGKGTTFTVYLPASQETYRETVITEEIKLDLSGNETILLAEDNEHVRKLALAVLKRHGYNVLVAESGVRALEILKAYHGELDLLVTDVIMPEINGRALYDKAITKYPDLKVLYMSGYTDNLLSQTGIQKGGGDFIQKPFTVQELSSKVYEILRRKG